MFSPPLRRLFLQNARQFRFSSTYTLITPSTPRPRVALVELNRPKALNALSSALIGELNSHLREVDKDNEIGAVVLTGGEKVFAAGADIKEMKDKDYSQVVTEKFIESWQDLTKVSKPIIAAVNGYALGGGCELAMMCDIIYASKTAKFGQPEIKLGTLPGAGGSQRMTHALGKSKSMELILSGKNLSAEDALKFGLIAQLLETPGECISAALDLAEVIGGYSPLAVAACKQAVNAAYEEGLSRGLETERRLFWGSFATQDRKIGMEAFVNKEKAKWVGK